MIEKIIHYVWFGNELDQQSKTIIDNWKKNHSDYKFYFWNENNYNELNLNTKESDYIQYCIGEKKYANISNLLRLKAIYNYGGVYLDTDMEILKPLHDLLNISFFVGAETNEYVNNAIIGAEKNNKIILDLLNNFNVRYDGKEEANYSSPGLMTDYFKNLGLNDYSISIIRKDFILYSPEYFYAFYGGNKKTQNTYTIHKFLKRW